MNLWNLKDEVFAKKFFLFELAFNNIRRNYEIKFLEHV